jgi:hypothetical protein
MGRDGIFPSRFHPWASVPGPLTEPVREELCEVTVRGDPGARRRRAVEHPE